MDKTRITSRPIAHRALGARSIVLSVLLGSHPPQMSVARVLAFTSLFGIADGAVRTALSRMVTAGDLENDDGVYRLTRRLRERQAQQDTGRNPPPDDWDDTWWVAAVLAERRSVAERREFRSQIVGARFGELRPDLWIRPANIDVRTDLSDVLLTRGPLFAGSGEPLVGQLWDLVALERDAIAHRGHLLETAARRARDGTSWLAVMFVALADCQRFLRTEPQLPVALAPTTVGNDLRATYDEVVAIFQADLSAFFGRPSGEHVAPTPGAVLFSTSGR